MGFSMITFTYIVCDCAGSVDTHFFTRGPTFNELVDINELKEIFMVRDLNDQNIFIVR